MLGLSTGGLFSGTALGFCSDGLFGGMSLGLSACGLFGGAALGLSTGGLFGGTALGLSTGGLFGGTALGFDTCRLFGCTAFGVQACRLFGQATRLGLAALCFALRRFSSGSFGLGPRGGFGRQCLRADAGEFLCRLPFGCGPGFRGGLARQVLRRRRRCYGFFRCLLCLFSLLQQLLRGGFGLAGGMPAAPVPQTQQRRQGQAQQGPQQVQIVHRWGALRRQASRWPAVRGCSFTDR